MNHPKSMFQLSGLQYRAIWGSIKANRCRRAWEFRNRGMSSGFRGLQGLRIWEFPKIGDPDTVPQIIGFLL